VNKNYREVSFCFNVFYFSGYLVNAGINQRIIADKTNFDAINIFNGRNFFVIKIIPERNNVVCCKIIFCLIESRFSKIARMVVS